MKTKTLWIIIIAFLVLSLIGLILIKPVVMPMDWWKSGLQELARG